MSGSSCARRRLCRFLPRTCTGKRWSSCPSSTAGDLEEGSGESSRCADSRSCTANTSTRCRTPPGEGLRSAAGAGARNYWKSHNFTATGRWRARHDDRLRRQVAVAAVRDLIGVLGGQASRTAPDATAYAQRDAIFVMNVHARWDSRRMTRPASAGEDLFKAAGSYATGGVYVNFMSRTRRNA